MRETQWYMWQSQVPQLRKNVQLCLNQLKVRSIHLNPPQNYEQKKQYIKQQFSEQKQSDEIQIDSKNQGAQNYQYLDVFAYMIEQKINVSLLQLCKEFQQVFGKNLQYWTNKITACANIINFSNKCTIWMVNDFVRSYINYKTSPLLQNQIRQWRPRAQSYLNSLIHLIGKITKLKKTEPNNYFMDQHYRTYHLQRILYQTYLSKSSSQFFEDVIQDVTMTRQNRSKAQRRLFNFPQAVKSIQQFDINKKRSINTLENYKFFKKNTNFENQNEQKSKQKHRRTQLQKFRRTLQRIGSNEVTISIQQLRNKLIQQKWAIKLVQYAQTLIKTYQYTSSQATYQPLHHFTSIQSPTYYFSYQNYPMIQKSLNFQNPYQLYQYINYNINVEYVYEELVAQQLDQDQDTLDRRNIDSDQEDDSLQTDQEEMFIDHRTIILPDGQEQDQGDQALRKMQHQNNQYGKSQWIAYRHNHQILDQFVMIPQYGEIPYTLQGTDRPISKKTRKQLSKQQSNQQSIQQDISINVFQRSQATQQIIQKQHSVIKITIKKIQQAKKLQIQPNEQKYLSIHNQQTLPQKIIIQPQQQNTKYRRKSSNQQSINQKSSNRKSINVYKLDKSIEKQIQI